MATTNLGLGDHWDQFVTKQVASGRYDILATGQV